MAIALSEVTEKEVRKWATKRELEPREGLERLVATAFSRLGALERYAASRADAPKGRPAKGKPAKGKPAKVGRGAEA